jgi:hypothetical protein
VCQNEGRSVWDGVSPINLREALPEESTWQTRRTLDDDDNGDSRWRAFLVPVVDPTRFGDEDDRDDFDYDD